jgi:hypothetical protein
MPLFNVAVSFTLLMVVQADDEDHADQVAEENAREALDDQRPTPNVNVRGEVTQERQLREGWTIDCVPYGGDGDTRLGELLCGSVQKDCA